MKLSQAKIGCAYQVAHIDLEEESKRHLANLGIKVETPLQLVSKTKANAIVMLKANRLAFDKSILDKIDVIEVQSSQREIPLTELEVGQSGYVSGIHADRQLKRHLMDMGITKQTKLYLRKVAPLGDPIEITLRGYELTLRKSEAQLITLFPIDDKETTQ